MESRKLFESAKQTELITLLASLGYQPDKVMRQDYWYRSPLREEHTASFKVNRDRNIWYDHGQGVGGNIIDFAARFFQCSAEEAAQKILEIDAGRVFSFHRQPTSSYAAGEKKEADEARLKILAIRPLQNISLVTYIKEREIPIQIAQQYCREVDFLINGREQYAIGFENQSGGFELRNKLFKGSSSPKDITFFDKGKQDIYVFEGFFDFLSFVIIRPQAGAGLTNCLVLNSLSFFEKSRPLMEQHDSVFLFLDRGKSGRQSTLKAQKWNKETGSEKYKDSSGLYQYRDDLNAWLVARAKQHMQPKQQQQPIKTKGRRL